MSSWGRFFLGHYVPKRNVPNWTLNWSKKGSIKMDECKICNLYNLNETIAKELLESVTYPWEVSHLTK